MTLLTEPACPDCGHAKIQHPKPLGFCISCHAMEMNGLLAGPVCRRWFASIFSQAEIEQLAKVPRDSFGQWDVCAVCECYWMEHMGALCPSGNTTFKPLVGHV